MNLFLEKIKNAISNPESISVVNIVSGVLIYTVDNYMLIGAACTFLSTSLIAILNKYNSYKQDKLDRTQRREIELMRFRHEINANNTNIGNLEHKKQ
ncbi:MAG: hypothetical protein CMJ25_15100 [Phycisphaerae bacterium]|nr:hypothetical protein [Phycisphaerae bacterium]|tara:strand:+ start:1321 stop:1611 length:291 start_codon:yes stop_codon:yes gene_type:complete